MKPPLPKLLSLPPLQQHSDPVQVGGSHRHGHSPLKTLFAVQAHTPQTLVLKIVNRRFHRGMSPAGGHKFLLATRRAYCNVADFILFYTKTDEYVWNRQTATLSQESARECRYVEENTGR